MPARPQPKMPQHGGSTASLRCCYHQPRLVARLVSLRGWRPAAQHVRSGVVISNVAEAEAGIRMAGPAQGALEGSAVAGPLSSLSDAECSEFTQAVIQAFLNIEGSRWGVQRSGHGGQQQQQQQQQQRGRPPGTPGERGLQGKVVGHLLDGGFDEEFLQSVPTNTLNWSIKTLGDVGALKLAEQLFHWMRVQRRANEHSFVKLCEACEACHAPVRALQAWRNMRRMQAAVELGPHAAAALLKAYRPSGDLRAALAVLEELRQRRVPLNHYAYNVALRLCADVGAADEALALLQQLRGSPSSPSSSAGNSSTWDSSSRQSSSYDGSSNGSSSRTNSGRSCSQLYPQQTGSSEPGSRHAPLRTDCRTYSAVLAALAAAGRWERVALVRRLMTDDGVQPDATLYAQLLSCAASAGKPRAAESVFHEMREAGVRPNRSHWNALLLALANGRQHAACTSRYQRMRAARLRPDGYTIVALARAAFHARLGLPAVQQLLEEMEQHDVPLSVETGTALLCCLRHVPPGQEAAYLQAATDLYARMRSGSSVTAAAGAAHELGACLQQAAAQAASAVGREGASDGGTQQQEQQQEQPGPLGDMCSTATYNSMMLVHLAVRDWAGVLAVFDDLEGSEALPNSITYDLVLAACRKAGWEDKQAQFEALRDSWTALGMPNSARQRLSAVRE